jgi:hypothetical protein
VTDDIQGRNVSSDHDQADATMARAHTQQQQQKQPSDARSTVRIAVD